MQSSTPASRPDVDIEEDLQSIIRNYAPLQMSRPYFSFKSHDGILRLYGTVRTPQTRRVLIENAARISGVRGIDDSDLYDDDQVRMEVGTLLPPGVYASVHGGVVALTGTLPSTHSAAGLVEAVNQLPGVRRVGAAMDNAENGSPAVG